VYKKGWGVYSTVNRAKRALCYSPNKPQGAQSAFIYKRRHQAHQFFNVYSSEARFPRVLNKDDLGACGRLTFCASVVADCGIVVGFGLENASLTSWMTFHNLFLCTCPARNHHFGRLSALRAHTKPPYKNQFTMENAKGA
jgi:hypothetical protein